MEFTEIEKDSFIYIDNLDSNHDYKLLNKKTIIGSSECALYFGELQVHDVIVIDGEVNVLKGVPYVNVLNHSLFFDETLYGPLTVDGEIFLNGELTII
jgi:hypothetical protein